MKQVTAAYAESMASRLRNPSHARVIFSNIDPDAASDGFWESNGQTPYTNLTTLDYNYAYKVPFATLELNRLVLDGKNEFPSRSGENAGFESDVLTGSDGLFVTQPTLTRTFSVNRNLPGMTLHFDTLREEWPTSVIMKLYLGGTVVEESTKSPDSSMLMFDVISSAIDKVEFYFVGALPQYRVRVEEIIFGVIRVFTVDDIVSVSQSNDVDPLTRRLPDENFSATILDFDKAYNPDNPTGIWEKIAERSPIALQFGYELDDESVEWLSVDNYLLTSKPTVGQSRVNFSGTGVINSMTELYRWDTVGEKTLYDMAESVLLDVGLPLDSSGNNPWVIDESLRDVSTTAVLPIDTHANCLQLIAHAGRCMLYSDENNIVHLKRFSVEQAKLDVLDFIIDFNSITEDTIEVDKIDQLKGVDVSMYSYVVEEELSEIANIVVEGEEEVIEYSSLASEVTISVTGGTIVSQEIFGRACKLHLSSGTKTVIISGKRMEESISTRFYASAQSGEIDYVENPLITSSLMRDEIAQHHSSYFNQRNTYFADYRGNPELETKDVISIETGFTDSIPVVVLADNIEYNGAIRGSLILKGLT